MYGETQREFRCNCWVHYLSYLCIAHLPLFYILSMLVLLQSKIPFHSINVMLNYYNSKKKHKHLFNYNGGWSMIHDPWPTIHDLDRTAVEWWRYSCVGMIVGSSSKTGCSEFCWFFWVAPSKFWYYFKAFKQLKLRP